MNRPSIEEALAELNKQRSTEPGEARTTAIEAALEKLNLAAPATINRTVGDKRQFIHSGDECDMVISITPKAFSVVVDWND